MKNTLESKIESYLKQQIKRLGGLCYKWKSTVNGVPDQIIIYNGQTHLVEVKRPGEKPRPSQVSIHRQIREQGVPVYTVDTNESIDAFIQDVLHAEVPTKTKTVVGSVIRPADAFKTN